MLNIRNWVTRGSERSVLIKKNIIASFLLKGISILISLQIVPLTINYVNPTQYGIWLTLSSLLAWFFFFDIGLTHGFRNRFAEAKAKGDIETARVYISTTYASLAIMFIIMMLSLTAINGFIDWSDILNIDASYRNELSRVFFIIVSFFGLNFVLSTFTTMLIADQKPAINSLLSVLGQTVSLLVIYILTQVDPSGNLINLAFISSGIPVLVILIASVIAFNTKYEYLKPAFGYIQFNKIKDILGLGVNFFIITTSMLFIFNLMNVIISRELGPESVTEYNIVYKYFNVAHMILNIIMVPFWSAFTDAYTRKDFAWMRNASKRLNHIWLMTIPTIAVMYVIAPYFYAFWIGDTVSISNGINISVAIYMIALMFGAVNMYMINGTGKIRIQLIIYLSFAIIAYPAMTYTCRHLGVSGLLILPTIVYAFQGIFCYIQLKKIIGGTASGLWNK